MKLVDLNGITAADLPVAELREHLRFGSGFADDTLQDGLLARALKAAIAAIEARTGKVLFRRSFRWSVGSWRSPCRQPLPVAPVTALLTLSVLARNGDVVGGGLADAVLLEDPQRPVIEAAGTSLPTIPVHGSAEIGFEAGFSPDWAGMPSDLAQAVILLAAHFYESRDEAHADDGNMPFGVASLIGRYRTVRILGGAPA